MGKQRRATKELAFDYIVIGTGASGAVFAKTLTDNKKISVLVLEAGENNDNDLPIRDSSVALELEEKFFAKYFWQGETIPQKELDERSFEWTTGRLSGGGTSINGQQYVRPTSAVLMEWDKMLGSLWSPEQAVKQFRRLEKFNGKTTNPDAHGYHGRIHIRQAPADPSTISQKLVSAIEQATGFSEILDYNDPNTPLGPFTRWQLYQQPNGQRESSSTAFLSSDIMTRNGFGVKGRKLRVLYRTTALRVLFNQNRAIGVEFMKEGKCLHARARKKVIISAGIHSAQLLMLSGIGPATLLQGAGIPVLYDNPNVGKNLHNHTLNTAVFTTDAHSHLSHGPDPNAVFAGGAFLPDPTPGADQHRRGVQLIGMASKENLSIIAILLNPKSRGSIKIQNKDPLKIVLADEGFFDHPADLEAVKYIFRNYIKKIAEKLRRIDKSYRLISPTPDIINNDKELEKYIKENFGHNHHHQGSLRMAPEEMGGVVDSLGQVYGVKNLIVADDSIIPFTVDGNTSAPAYLIGLTIAQQLLNPVLSVEKNKGSHFGE